MSLKNLYDRYESRLEDFWGRRENDLRFKRGFRIFGCPVELSSNREEVLESADISAVLYSGAPGRERQPFRLRFVVRPAAGDAGPPPEDPFDHVRYTGAGDWIHLGYGPWGSAFADLRSGEAVAVLSAELAARPDLISRGLLNTLLNNYLTRNGFAMLHATGLVRGRGVLMLMAPHNSGKSTTALRLTLSRHFKMLSDSQIYLSDTNGGLFLAGFPVGRGKLRQDMLPEFPELQPLITPERVREETKYVLDLRELDPSLVHDQAVFPEGIDLCLLRPNGKHDSAIRPASLEEAWEAVMLNSLHFDYREIWEENLRLVESLVSLARLYHLEIGTDGAGIVETVRSIGV